jgi:hypothetical protein
MRQSTTGRKAKVGKTEENQNNERVSCESMPMTPSLTCFLLLNPWPCGRLTGLDPLLAPGQHAARMIATGPKSPD